MLGPLAIACVVAAAAPRVGHAAPPRPANPVESPHGTRSAWYGWQVVLADGVGYGTMALVIGGDVPSEGLFVLGLGLAVGGGTVVHALHRDPTAAMWALPLRAGALIGGVLVGTAVADDADDPAFAACAIGGLVLGTILDAGLLGWKEIPVGPPPARPHGRFLAPRALVLPGGGGLGIAGAF